MEVIEIKQAVILAGGRGERLRPLTDHIPKPMAPVDGMPFLSYLIKSVLDAGIRRILLLTGYKAEVIIEYYGRQSAGDLRIDYSIGSAEDETGRRLLNAYDLLDRHFLLMYGDNYWPIELDRMAEHYRTCNVPVMTTIFDNATGTGEYGSENNILVGPDGLVQCYDKTRRTAGLNGVDIGYFIVAREVLDRTREGNLSLERDVLVDLAAQRRVSGFMTHAQYYYITDIANLRAFEKVAGAEGYQPMERCAVMEAAG